MGVGTEQLPQIAGPVVVGVDELALCRETDLHPGRRLAARLRNSDDAFARFFAADVTGSPFVGEEYYEYLRTDFWREYRSAVLARQGGACATCCRDATHCHHRTYARCGHERDGDCIGLCADCHALLHADRRSGQ